MNAVQHAKLLASEGFRLVPSVGKVGQVKGFGAEHPTFTHPPDLFGAPDVKVGVLCGPTADPNCNWWLICIDVDGDMNHPEITTFLSLFPETLSSHGGRHLFFGVPPCPARAELKQWTDLLSTKRSGAAIDLKWCGGYAEESGDWSEPPSLDLVAVLEPEEVEMLVSHGARATKAKVAQRAIARGVTDPVVIDGATKWLLEVAPVAVEGAGGHNTLMVVVGGLLVGFGLDEDAALDLMLDHYNPRCLPPWDDDDAEQTFQHKIDQIAEQGSTTFEPGRLAAIARAAATGLPKDPPALPAPKITDPIDPSAVMSWSNSLRTKDSIATKTLLKRVAGGVAISASAVPAVVASLCEGFPAFSAESIANAIAYSASHADVNLASIVEMVNAHRTVVVDPDAESDVIQVGILTKTQGFVGRLALRQNLLTNQVEFNGEPWTDVDTSALRIKLEQAGISPPERPMATGTVHEAVQLVARRKSYHPVHDYLASLPEWDGVERLPTLFVKYMHCEDSPQNRAVGICFGVAAIARILHPGCKHDLMPILLGEQGGKKSSAIQDLAGGYPIYSDAKLNVSHRSDAYETLQECWIYECAELHAFDRAEQNVIKNLVSQQQDRYLAPYARTRISKPRCSVMIGTTNQEECLKDPTGSRRYPVLRCTATYDNQIDRAALVRDRDQIWAEAAARHARGEQWWLTEEMAKAFDESNEAFVTQDGSWEDRIQKWLKQPTMRDSGGHYEPESVWPEPDVSIGELLEHAIGIEVAKQGKAEQTRVGILLRKLKVPQVDNPAKRGARRYRVK